jgi:hypothetical protein
MIHLIIKTLKNMKLTLIYIFIAVIIATTYFSCVGYQGSVSVGYGVSSGPYGYGGYGGYGGYRYPNVNVGVYRGGYRGWR